MNPKFLEKISKKHTKLYSKFPNQQVSSWASHLLSTLIPSENSIKISNSADVQKNLEKSKSLLSSIVQNLQENKENLQQVIKEFYNEVSQIQEDLEKDISERFVDSKQVVSLQQINSSYPQFNHIVHYRLSHWFYKKGLQNTSSSISQISQGKNNIFIHPASQIGPGFVLHGLHSIEIGETTLIGSNVKVYDGVVLGTLQKNQNGKRNPIIQQDVTIFSGATILGSNIVVGRNSVIGSKVNLNQSVLPNSQISIRPSVQITPKNIKDLYTVQSLIGNTPLVEIKNIFSHPHVKIYAKLQGQNPGGSVKDRPAYNMIKQALKRGDIKPGMKLIQPTSGNTGIALAMISCIFNLDIELIMPQNSTIERVQTMQAYGAKVILTPAKQGIQGSRDYAEAQVAKGGYKMLNQFANPDNYMAHYHSTGPQIWRDTKGSVTHFVSSMGTTGTIMGTSMFLKEKNKDIQIVGVQPLEGAKIPGIRRWPIQYVPKIFNKERVDHIIDVGQQQSVLMMKRLAKQQGIFGGMSSGGAMAAAVRLAQTLQKGTIVSIVCDRGDRYLSSGIFGNSPQ